MATVNATGIATLGMPLFASGVSPGRLRHRLSKARSENVAGLLHALGPVQFHHLVI
jgi:hypothetical protein